MSQTKNYFAVIDIGSNSVRLVVYDGIKPAPVRVFNERNLCGLGRDLAKTGKLSKAGVKQALDSLARFSGLIKAMKIKQVKAVATAAVRDADDGAAFVAKVKKQFGIDIEVIEGKREAALSALGVLSNFTRIENGIIGDLGGGSLELVHVVNNRVKEQITLPLGALRLMAQSTRTARLKTIDKYLETVPFLRSGQELYVLGGAWRSMARAHMYMQDHPIFVLDHYRIPGARAQEFAGLIAKQSLASLSKTAGLSKRRVRDMPAAALLLDQVLHRMKPKAVHFSGTGLREGLIYEQLSPSQRRHDPLIASCKDIGAETSRFGGVRELDSLHKWMLPIFEQDDETARAVHAAALLSDIGWFEHENYQAEHAFRRILRLPLFGASHAERAVLALAVCVRYQGYLRRTANRAGITGPVQKILGRPKTGFALQLGLAMKLAYTMTGGALSLLRYTRLKRTESFLTLELQAGKKELKGQIIEDALAELAKELGCTPRIRTRRS